MTKKQLLKESEKMLKNIEHAVKAGYYIAVRDMAQQYADLIRRYVEFEEIGNSGKGLSPK